jgi:hypothetical protein
MTTKSRTSKNCAKIGPATSTSACQQMEIAVMSSGKAIKRIVKRFEIENAGAAADLNFYWPKR